MPARLFQYAILFHPLRTKRDEDEGKETKSEVVKEIMTILAKDDKEAMILAARGIPTEYLDKLSQVEIALRPF